MSEQEIRAVLEAYSGRPAPAAPFADIRREAGRRRARRRWTRAGVSLVALAFLVSTFLPGVPALAAARQEISPTLFLVTDLAEAQQVARSPLELPASVPSYRGQTLALGPETPALVGRWLSYETVGVTVTEPVTDRATGRQVDSILFDLRRSTNVTDELIPAGAVSAGATTRAVKVGENEGTLVDQGGILLRLYWRTATHSYRLEVPGVQSADDLIRIAAEIR